MFFFIPFLIIGFSNLKKSSYEDKRKNNSLIGYCFVIAGFLFMVSAALTIAVYVEYNPYSSVDYELIRNIAFSSNIFSFGGYILLLCPLLGLRKDEKSPNLRNSIINFRFLLLGWFLVNFAMYIYDILLFSGAVSSDYDTMLIVSRAVESVIHLIMAIFLVCVCFSNYLRESSEVVRKTGQTISLIYLSTTTINIILSIINDYVLDSSYYLYLFVDPYSPMTNVIQLIEAVKTISIYLTIIIIGIEMFNSKIKSDSLQNKDTSFLSLKLFKSIVVILLMFYLIENNYFMSKLKAGINGVFLTTYINEITGSSFDAILSVYSVSYLILTILVTLLLIRKHIQQTSDEQHSEDKNKANGLLITGIILIALSMMANFAFRLYLFISHNLSSETIFYSITVVKTIEVLVLMILGILFIGNSLKNYVSDLLGERSRLLPMVGIALIFQSISGIGSILQNYYNLIAYPGSSIGYKVISSISMFLYEASSIMLIVFIILLTLDSIKKNTHMYSVVKTLSIVILVILSVFKLLLMVGSFIQSYQFLEMLMGYQFQISASVFDGLAAIIFIYIVMVLCYRTMVRILGKTDINLNSLSIKDRITEVQY